jgi:hypothetical protein
MPAIKDLARTVIHQQWGTPDPVFDALWNTLADVPRQTAPVNASSDAKVHALAAAGAIAEPPAIAVFIFTQAAHDLPGDVTWGQLCAKITEIAGVLGYKGIGKRVTAGEPPPATHDTLPPKIAMLYADETGQGIAETTDGVAIDEATAAEVQKHPGTYSVFLYHKPGLPEHIVGQVSFNGVDISKAKPIDPAAQEPKRRHLTITEYRILTYVLKHRNRADQCTIEDLIEHCFRDHPTAAELRKRDLSDQEDLEQYREDTKKYRATIGDLSTLLQYYAGSALRSGKTKKYGLVPWCTYCLIEPLPVH